MSNDLNRCEFIGRLGGDPETRSLQNGNTVTNINLAVGRQWKDKHTGEKKESTEWVRVVIFGKLAEVCSQYLAKGSRVFLAGSLRTEKWQDNDGNDRYTTKIIAGELQMLDSKGQQQAPQQQQQQKSAPTPPPSQPDLDEDIPF